MKSTSRSPRPSATCACSYSASRKHAEHRPADAEPLDRAVRAHQHRQVVAGVRVGQHAGRRVEHAVEEADEAPFGDVAAEDPVDLLAERLRLGRFGRERAHRGLQVGHQQRRGDALADDVGDREREPRVAEADRVEAVAADAGRRLPRDGELPAVDLRASAAAAGALDPQRLGQLALLGRPRAAPRAAGLDLRRAASRAGGRCPTASARSRARRGASPRPRDRRCPSRSSRSPAAGDRAAWTRASRSIPSRPDVVSPV